jgi:hypothetical protein
MFETRRWYLLLAIVAIVLPLAAQPAISTKAGLLNYFEGQVLLDGEQIEYNVAKFPQMPSGSVLEAADRGRAEVLLSPGVMLWVGEGAKIELVSDDLVNPIVRLLAGNSVLSGTDFPKEAAVTMLVNDSSVKISEGGIYRFDAAPATLEVEEGKAEVTRASVDTVVKKGRSLLLDDPNANLAKIDKNEPADSLLLWAESRDNYIHMANLSAARQAQLGGGFPGSTMGMLGAYQGFGGWMFNPYFGMFTLVPFGNSMMMSPFGNTFWSPFAAQRFFYTPIFAGLAGGGGQRIDRRAMNSRNSVSRGGFSNNAAFGNYSRGISVQAGGGVGRGGMSRGAASGGFGGRGMSSPRGGFGSGPSFGGSMGRGSVGGGAVSAPTSSGGASMGRGGASAGRGGGGGGRGRN